MSGGKLYCNACHREFVNEEQYGAHLIHLNLANEQDIRFLDKYNANSSRYIMGNKGICPKRRQVMEYWLDWMRRNFDRIISNKSLDWKYIGDLSVDFYGRQQFMCYYCSRPYSNPKDFKDHLQELPDELKNRFPLESTSTCPNRIYHLQTEFNTTQNSQSRFNDPPQQNTSASTGPGINPRPGPGPSNEGDRPLGGAIWKSYIIRALETAQERLWDEKREIEQLQSRLNILRIQKEEREKQLTILKTLNSTNNTRNPYNPYL